MKVKQEQYLDHTLTKRMEILTTKKQSPSGQLTMFTLQLIYGSLIMTTSTYQNTSSTYQTMLLLHTKPCWTYLKDRLVYSVVERSYIFQMKKNLHKDGISDVLDAVSPILNHLFQNGLGLGPERSMVWNSVRVCWNKQICTPFITEELSWGLKSTYLLWQGSNWAAPAGWFLHCAVWTLLLEHNWTGIQEWSLPSIEELVTPA